MYKKLKRFEQILFDVCAVFLVLFYTYSAVIDPAETQYHRGVYIISTYILVFLLYCSKSTWLRVIDYLLIVASIVSIGYWILNFEVINYRIGAETTLDTVMAVIGVLVSIELARRVVGSVFVILGIMMLTYGVYGYLMPDLISHAGDTFPELCVSIFYRGDGIFGIMANVLATYVLLFVLFGAFLDKSGAQKFFIDLSLASVGHKIGGPGKVAVIASGLFGSISGSAIANVVSTGAFTIPMMKKAGFKPHQAGGIEPAASIGGMFMPPIMGAGGFVMAELTGLSYSLIMTVSLFPALMYFFSVFMMVHYEAKKLNIVGERSEYSGWDVFKSGWHYIIPLVLITLLMFFGYSPAYAAVIGIVACIVISRWQYLIPIVLIALLKILDYLPANIAGYGLVACIAVAWLRSDARIGPKRFLEAAREGAENSLKIGATVGVIGIIIGVLTYSGLMLTLADIVIELADGSLLLTIALVALVSLVMGMGVPVTASYLIIAVVAVPALTHLGVNELAAHMIVYWLSQDSNITPPVCIAAFAGATIAKANMWKTAFSAFKFAKFLYLGPLLFGLLPEFSLFGFGPEIPRLQELPADSSWLDNVWNVMSYIIFNIIGDIVRLDGSYWDIAKVFVYIFFGTWLYSYILSGIWLQTWFGKKQKT